MKRKFALLFSGLALLLCLLILAGATYAWFVVKGSESPGRIDVGYLDLSVLGYDRDGYNSPIYKKSIYSIGVDGETNNFGLDTTPPLIEDVQIAPGFTGTKFIKVKNEGNLDLKFTIDIEFSEGFGFESGAWLGEVLRYQVSYYPKVGDDPTKTMWDNAIDYDPLDPSNNWETLSKLEVELVPSKINYGDDVYLVNIGNFVLDANVANPAEGEEIIFRIDYLMCDYAGNTYQIKTFNADINLFATQKANTEQP